MDDVRGAGVVVKAGGEGRDLPATTLYPGPLLAHLSAWTWPAATPSIFVGVALPIVLKISVGISLGSLECGKCKFQRRPIW